jgi:DNA-directed RNA polymerase subunit RPC12/RpoP
MDKLQGKCFWCKKEVAFDLKKMSDQKEHYVCPGCNSTNSEFRLKKEAKEK